MKTPKAKSLQLDDDSKPKVKFSPKVMLFEGKMSLAESKAGLPDSPLTTPSAGKKSNLKRVPFGGDDSAMDLSSSAKKTLDLEPVEVDKKVVKLKEKIKKKRELMKALPNRKGLGQVDPKTKRVIKKNAAGDGAAAATTPPAMAAAPVKKIKKKKVKDGTTLGKVAGNQRKTGAPGAKIGQSSEDVVLKVKKNAAAPAAAAGVTTPKKKGEKRKRDANEDDGQTGAQKVVVVDGESDAIVKPAMKKKAAAAAKKPAAGLSKKVYQKFHGKNTLTENKQKLAGMKKKERKVFRQQQKMGDNWSQLKEIKIIWESMRRASLDSEKRKSLCDTLCTKIKGNVKTLCFMHDISRALQCLIKHATTEQRDAIFDEIKGDLVEMAKK